MKSEKKLKCHLSKQTTYDSGDLLEHQQDSKKPPALSQDTHIPEIPTSAWQVFLKSSFIENFDPCKQLNAVEMKGRGSLKKLS